MKTLVLAAAFTAAASAGFAGNISEPLLEPEVIVEEASSSSSGDIVIPLLLLLVIAAAAS